MNLRQGPADGEFLLPQAQPEFGQVPADGGELKAKRLLVSLSC